MDITFKTTEGRFNFRVCAIIRLEQESDYRLVEEITRLAFSYAGRVERGGIGCPFEHWMVHELRKRDGILQLSFVAEIDFTLVGHIICSDAHIETLNGKSVHVLNFGPVSVIPEYQRKGIGKALMNHMITIAKELGYGAIIFCGRPEYYPQFGFVEAAEYGITDCNGKNYPALMAMELKKGYLNSLNGSKYYESDVYNDDFNKKEVIEFDKLF